LPDPTVRFSSPKLDNNSYIKGLHTEGIQKGEIMDKDKISEEMTIKEVIDTYPETAMVFMKYK
jgi:hypothetical protein